MPLKTSIEIRKAQTKDINQLFRLFKEAYKYNPRMQERDFFDWQFRKTPFAEDDEYSFLVLCDGEEIKGFLGYVPIQFRYGDEIRSGCFSYNWYSVEKDRSGIKLLAGLMGRYDNIFYLGCTADSEAIFKMFQIPMAHLPRWVGVIDPNKVKMLFAINSDPCKRKIERSCRHLNVLGPNVNSIRSCDRFGPDEEFFFHQWKSIKGFCRRTGRYLNWRYVDIPRHNYKIIRGKEDQFAVYRIEPIKHHSETVIRVLEWNFYGSLAEEALAYILKEGKDRGSILVDFFCTAADVGRLMESLGFFMVTDGTEGIPYLFRPVHYARDILMAIDLPPHRVERQFDFNQWYITKGDSDMDRIKL